ncbi:hypothetical protein PanWU01x14_366200, partial [Parasponia andersonii]
MINNHLELDRSRDTIDTIQDEARRDASKASQIRQKAKIRDFQDHIGKMLEKINDLKLSGHRPHA